MIGQWRGSSMHPYGHADSGWDVYVSLTSVLGVYPHISYSTQTRSVGPPPSLPHRRSPNPGEQSSGLARSRTGCSYTNGRESFGKRIVRTKWRKTWHPTHDPAELVFLALARSGTMRLLIPNNLKFNEWLIMYMWSASERGPSVRSTLQGKDASVTL